MNETQIRNASDHLINQYDTRDPFELADCLGIEIILSDALKKVKGFYTIYDNIRFITISNYLNHQIQCLVCAHESGHDQLHSNLLQGAFAEFSLYQTQNRAEYEANLFAANILISDEDFFNLAYDGYTRSQIAAFLKTDPNIVSFKAQLLKSTGYPSINEQEILSTFLQ
ncbi:MAG: ImmA/IrrE family metallo-endopeptidase [Clostridia bacterium]|nr:ImmA/IrrE family metallo-endopeptidase [Clostridia bacterium]